jgi:hypothetical protein
LKGRSILNFIKTEERDKMLSTQTKEKELCCEGYHMYPAVLGTRAKY